MTYGIQKWGQAKSSNSRPIRAFKSIRLRQITGAAWYARLTRHSINVQTVNELVKRQCERFRAKPHFSTNILRVFKKYSRQSSPRRLKTKWPRDVLVQKVHAEKRNNEKKLKLNFDESAALKPRENLFSS